LSMDETSLDKLIKENFLALILVAGAVILLIFGIYQLVLKPSKSSLTLEENSKNSEPSASKILVDVAGAVNKPGTYTLTTDARYKDAIKLAGGISPEADEEWIEKNLNQASRVSDGMKIYIPRVGEQASSTSTSTVAGASQTGLINVNLASSSELDTLPGIGPVTAQKIIDNRPYSQISDLVSKKAVTQSVFDKIKDKISI